MQSGRVIGSKKVSTIFHTILITRVRHAWVVKSCFAELPIRLLLGLRLQIHSDPWEFQDPKMEVLCHIRPHFVGSFCLPWPFSRLL